jgi:hypothetical protein
MALNPEVQFTLDDVNVIAFDDLEIGLMAIEDKIIIMLDEYKSGYECKYCKGTGKIEEPSPVVEGAVRKLPCSACGGKGASIVIPDNAKSLPSTGIVVSMGPETLYQRLKKELAIIGSQPGLIVNNYIDDVKRRKEYLEQEIKTLPIQLGVRVVFNAHVGTFVPIRNATRVRLKIMRVTEPLCILFGTGAKERDLIDYTAEVS